MDLLVFVHFISQAVPTPLSLSYDGFVRGFFSPATSAEIQMRSSFFSMSFTQFNFSWINFVPLNDHERSICSQILFVQFSFSGEWRFPGMQILLTKMHFSILFYSNSRSKANRCFRGRFEWGWLLLERHLMWQKFVQTHRLVKEAVQPGNMLQLICLKKDKFNAAWAVVVT